MTEPFGIPAVRAALRPGARALLDTILALPHAVERDGEDLVFRFEGDDEAWTWSPGALLGPCGEMALGEPGTLEQITLHDGTRGTLHALGEARIRPDRMGFAYHPGLIAPIDVGLHAFYLVHPRTGRLWWLDEGPPQEVVDTDDPVEVYLREVWHEVGAGPHHSTWLREVPG